MKYVNFFAHKDFPTSQSTFLALQISSSNFSIFSNGYGLIDKINYSLIVTRTMVVIDRMNISNNSMTETFIILIERNVSHFNRRFPRRQVGKVYYLFRE